jgi:hypothetical protein
VVKVGFLLVLPQIGGSGKAARRRLSDPEKRGDLEHDCVKEHEVGVAYLPCTVLLDERNQDSLWVCIKRILGEQRAIA